MHFSKALFAVLLAVNLCCVAAEGEKTEVNTKILVLNMRFSNGQHQVLNARLVDSAVPLKQRAPSPTALAYTVTDGGDQPLMVATMEDPRMLRGPMSPGSEGHPVTMLDSADYVLRVPYSSNMRFLKFLSAAPAANAVRARISNDQARQSIDLQEYLELKN